MKETRKMPVGQIEHANLTVTDPERSAALFEQLLGWRERWRGPAQMGGWTIHVGTETEYLALYTDGEAEGGYAKGSPLNHVGFQVDDLGAAERVVKQAGLEPFSHGDYEPGRRFYFFDWDGIEFEVVSYAS
jgi:catechol 2,3-dioxygenase-like lactoylglutathione lyase family enzyme